jgi:hypothetical protein
MAQENSRNGTLNSINPQNAISSAKNFRTNVVLTFTYVRKIKLMKNVVSRVGFSQFMQRIRGKFG